MTTYPFTAYDLRTRQQIVIVGKHPTHSRCYVDKDGYPVHISDVTAELPKADEPEMLTCETCGEEFHEPDGHLVGNRYIKLVCPTCYENPPEPATRAFTPRSV